MFPTLKRCKDLNIFEYNDYRDFLISLPGRLNQNRRLSQRQLASKLGYNSPRTVGMFFNGKRLLSRELLDRLARHMKYTAKEKEYLSLLVQKEKARILGRETQEFESELDSLRPKELKRTPISETNFRYIYNWYFFVIHELASTIEVVPSPEWVVERLNHSLSLSDAKLALVRLCELGFLERSREPIGYRYIRKNLITSTDVPSSIGRMHLLQMIQKAHFALKTQNILKREYTDVTLRFNAENMIEAKEFIRQFRDAFDAKFSTGKATDVYQLNIQFFSHTQGVNRDLQNKLN